ncbi:MAG: type II toxin-antitoxin system RelE/ParE family toxin [Candidatus Acidiferrales bacterium]
MSADRLVQFPRLGSVLPEAGDENVRELIVRSYRLIHRIAGERIEVLSIAHGRRDMQTMSRKPWEID